MLDITRDKYFNQYNFGSIDNNDDDHETAEGNYDFGDVDEILKDPIVNRGDYDFSNGENFYLYIVKRFVDALRDVNIDGSIYLRRKPLYNNPASCGIFLQYYFTKEKVYIEFDYDDQFKQNFDTTAITSMIHRYIHANLHYDTKIWPEILLIEDSNTIYSDTFEYINPFVIGYWKSINGKFQFLTNRTKVLVESQNTTNTTGISRNFEKFVEDVSLLRNKYYQTALSKENKKKFFDEYIEICKTSSKENLSKNIEELKNKYKIKSQLNELVPEIYQEYYKLYKKYFNTELPNYSVEEHTHKMYLEILNEKGE